MKVIVTDDDDNEVFSHGTDVIALVPDAAYVPAIIAALTEALAACQVSPPPDAA